MELTDAPDSTLSLMFAQIYELALKAINCTAEEVIFMDDSLRNVASARTELGISTVLVSPEGKKFWACPLVFLASLELAFN